MSDFGNAAASGGSSSSSSLDQLFSDASLGDALTGGTGDLFGGGGGIGGGTPGGGDLATLFADAGLGSALLGDSSGLGGVFSTVDPSGTQAATQSMTPAADAVGTPQGSDPSSNIGGTQSGGAPQPTKPQAKQDQPTTPQNQSPLATIAKALGASFGLGAKPTAGGPTGFEARQLALPGAAVESVAPGGAAAVAAPLAGAGFLLPFMSTPAETGELPYGYGGSPNQPARPVTPTPAPPGREDPTIAAGGPGAGAAQPPAAVAKPAPAAAPAPAAPAAPAPATADLPTRKEPETPEAAPEPPQGFGGPTGGMGGIGELLRDVLGMTLASPVALPLLAQLLMGGRGPRRGGIPPWAMHGMMPFMRGTRRGFVGFRGGFLRPGYYPRRQGGWGFHPGGYHPGWGAWAPGVMGNQPMAFAGGGGMSGGGGATGGWQGANVQSGGIPNVNAGDAGSTDANGRASSSNPFISTLLGQESGGENIVSRTDKDDAGRTLAQGGNPDQISQGYFQIRPSTWRIYAERAGVNPNILPRQANYADQWKVASVIPAGEWGPDTKRLLASRFGNINWREPLGQVASRFGGTQVAGGGGAPPSSSTSRAPGFRIRDQNQDPLTSHTYPAPTETTGAPAPVQSDDFASAG